MSRQALDPQLTLSPGQEDLLQLALSSNLPASDQQTANSKTMANATVVQEPPSPEDPGSGQFSSLDDDPSYENLDDANFEWDENGEAWLAGQDGVEDGDLHDKRKASVDPEDASQAGGKRQEGEGKLPKKPGRKLVTTEPTTKRKAQNRAAQRAFRDRKERHLKDLETKVDDLEKASEATNHENGRLRAQVEKLTTEVSEYRKRLSMSSSAASYSSPPSGVSRSMYGSGRPSNDFSFSFPKFGDLPGMGFLSNGSAPNTTSPKSNPSATTPTGSQRKQSSNSVLSNPMSTVNMSFVNAAAPVASPQTSVSGAPSVQSSGFDDLSGLFSPSILENAGRTSNTDYVGPKGTSNNVKQNSNTSNASNQAAKPGRMSSASFTNSPTSSASNIGLDSSAGTTPEPSSESPENGKLNETVQTTRPAPPASSKATAAFPAVVKSPASDINGIDWLAQQNGGQFDPVLFSEYRDPQDSFLNTSFDDFFTDALPAQDFSSPYNTGDQIPPEPKKDLMREIESKQNGDDTDTIPGTKPEGFLGCDQLWDRVQASEKYQSGEADMDQLCSELKSKAKCSGQGAMVNENDVTAILGPAKEDNDGSGAFRWG